MVDDSTPPPPGDDECLSTEESRRWVCENIIENGAYILARVPTGEWCLLDMKAKRGVVFAPDDWLGLRAAIESTTAQAGSRPLDEESANIVADAMSEAIMLSYAPLSRQ